MIAGQQHEHEAHAVERRAGRRCRTTARAAATRRTGSRPPRGRRRNTATARAPAARPRRRPPSTAPAAARCRAARHDDERGDERRPRDDREDRHPRHQPAPIHAISASRPKPTREHVVLDLAGLDPPQPVAAVERPRADDVQDAVDEIAIDPADEPAKRQQHVAVDRHVDVVEPEPGERRAADRPEGRGQRVGADDAPLVGEPREQDAGQGDADRGRREPARARGTPRAAAAR